MCPDPLPHLSNLEPDNATIKIFAVKSEPLHDADVFAASLDELKRAIKRIF